MKRYLLTGAPGAGKTTLVRRLEALGHAVVAEAATDHILEAQAAGDPEPWTSPGFIDAVTALQRARRLAPPPPGAILQFHDRSVFCTEALRRHLGAPACPALAAEIAEAGEVFERRVFMIGLMDFIEPTAVRRISLSEARDFERVHEEVYREHGFVLEQIWRGPVEARLAQLLAAVA